MAGLLGVSLLLFELLFFTNLLSEFSFLPFLFRMVFSKLREPETRLGAAPPRHTKKFKLKIIRSEIISKTSSRSKHQKLKSKQVSQTKS